MICVKKPKIVDDNELKKLVCEIFWGDFKRELWFEFPSCYENNIDLSMQDYLLLALLIPAMGDSLDIHFEGNLSPILLHNAKNDLQAILMAQNEYLKKILITCEGVDTLSVNGECNIGVGFSAGVDSLSSLAILEQANGLRPTHLVSLNVGAIGEGDISRQILKNYSERIDVVSKENNFTPLTVDSNLTDFYTNFTFQATHTIRTASAILALGNTFKHYFYSSGFTYKHISVRKTSDMANADPILLPLFSTNTTQFSPLGTGLKRIDKVKLVCDYPTSFKFLDVCVALVEERLNGENCGKCAKCIRQQITLDLFGRLEDYNGVFNTEKYSRYKKELFYKLAMSALDPNRLGGSDLEAIKKAIEIGRVQCSNFSFVQRTSSYSWKIRDFWSWRLADSFVK